MKKHNFLLLREEKQDVVEIEKEICQDPSAVLEVSDSWQAIFDRIITGGVDSIVCNLVDFNDEAMIAINKLHSMNRTLTKTIVSAKSHSVDLALAKKQDQQVVFVPKPVRRGAIAKLTKKIRQGEPVFLREHIRFKSEQKARFERINGGTQWDGTICNMSKGGAYVEFVGPQLVPGDIISFTVRLDKLSKVHTLHGKVVWALRHPQEERKLCVGLKFMKEEEVYNSLLEKVG